MSTLRRLLACLALLALVASGSALADHQEPEKRISAADQKRGRAMLLKRSDLGPGFTRDAPSNEPDPHVNCAPSVSEADLTQTGDVKGPNLTRGSVVFVNSAAQLYESVADASASWQRGTSPAGLECQRALARRQLATDGLRLVSLREIAFPRMAQRTVGYRVVLTTQVQGQTVRIYGDVVVLMHSRAHAQVTAVTPLRPIPRAELISLARVVSVRMTRAMR